MRWLLHILLLGLSLSRISAGPAADIQSRESVERKLYVTKCAKCHKLYAPNNYSESDWQKWMSKMSRKAKLSPDQRESIERYIVQNLRPVKPVSSADGTR